MFRGGSYQVPGFHSDHPLSAFDLTGGITENLLSRGAVFFILAAYIIGFHSILIIRTRLFAGIRNLVRSQIINLFCINVNLRARPTVTTTSKFIDRWLFRCLHKPFPTKITWIIISIVELPLRSILAEQNFAVSSLKWRMSIAFFVKFQNNGNIMNEWNECRYSFLSPPTSARPSGCWTW